MIAIKLLILFLSLAPKIFAEVPHEGFDAKTSASLQTYPFGAMTTVGAGYAVSIWKGNDELEDNFWKYGYTRVAAKLQTAAVTNRLTAEIEFYPISIFGLGGGGGIDARNYHKFSGVDCNNLMCDHTIDFKFVNAQLVAGFSKFVVIAAVRYDWYHTDSQDQPFYDYMSYLIGRPSSDDMRSLTVLALYRHAPAVYGILNYIQGPWQATAGVGDFHNDFEPQHASAIFSIRYTFQKSIALVD